MLRLDYPEIEARQVSIVESLLLPEILKLPTDLQKVDQILQDERFEEPFIVVGVKNCAKKAVLSEQVKITTLYKNLGGSAPPNPCGTYDYKLAKPNL